MTLTLAIALFGAVTGAYGALVATLGRRDVAWRRRAKQLSVVRPALEALRDAMAEVKSGRRATRTLAEATLRARLEELEENGPRLSDRQLRTKVDSVIAHYSRVTAAGDDAPDHRRDGLVEAASTALRDALARADVIKKKAPA